MLAPLASEIWFNQQVYVPIGYLLVGIVLALFVPADQIVGVIVDKLPGEYELKVEKKDR